MKDTASSYFDKYKERYEKEYQAFKDGAYTEAQFKAWVQTQVARGEGYEKMADKLAKRMVEADKVASAYINDATPTIYSLNKNYESYRISQAEKVDFHLTDEQTTKELMQGRNHTEFKTTSIDPKRDYEWNSKKIHNALNSAILQGKTIDQLTDSFYAVMKSDRASAIRNARTSFTSAQNAGRMDSYEEATAMGINLEKEWIATKDDRTRDSHGELDGVRIPYDELFDNGLMYPADPDGEPCEVYNCRCTMRAVLPNINDKPRETYKDWLERMKPEEAQEDSFKNVENISEKLANALNDKLKSAEEDARQIFNEYSDKCKVVNNNYTSTAHFNPKEFGVYFNEEAIFEGDVCSAPLNTAFHEFAHNIDYSLGLTDNSYYSVDYKDGAIGKALQADYEKLVEKAYKADEVVYNKVREWIDTGLLTDSNIISEIRNADKGDGVLKELARTYRREHTSWEVIWSENKDILTKAFDNTSDTQKGKYVIEMLKGELASSGIDIETVEGKRAICCISDMIEGLTGVDYSMGVGHGSWYYEYGKYEKLSKELWAEVLADKSTNPEGIELTRKYFGSAVSTVEEAIKEAI